jgi:uncharacterized membrane protein
VPETDYSEFESKTSGDRTTMNVLYGLHTVAPFTMWSLAVIALIVNYIRRSGETDAVYVSHHNYMIATFWWTLLWLVLTGPLWLLLVFPGWIAWSIIGLWYIYRCIRGWLRFSENRPPA